MGLDAHTEEHTLKAICESNPEEVLRLLKGLVRTCIDTSVDLTPFIERGQVFSEQRKKDQPTSKEIAKMTAEAGEVEEAKEEPPRKMCPFCFP